MPIYIYSMKKVFLIVFVLVAQVFADLPRTAYDSADPEAYDASSDSCQCRKEQSELTQNTYKIQRTSLSKKERREYVQLIDRQLDSVAMDCHLGLYGRSQLGYYASRRIFALDLSFFIAMPTIDDSFNKIRFYGMSSPSRPLSGLALGFLSNHPIYLDLFSLEKFFFTKFGKKVYSESKFL